MAHVNGVELGYRIVGQGEPLLLIMGYAGTMDVWDPLLVKRLSESYRVIMFDNRGMGYSSAPNAPMTNGLMAEDAAGLLDALGIDKAHVMGWSMGSLIAQELAFARPGKVDKLVLYGSAHENEPVVEALKRFAAMTPEQFRAALFPAKWAEAHPDAFSRLPSPAVPADPAVVARQAAAQAVWQGTTNRLGDLDKEVLLIVGEEDGITPVEQSLELSGLIPGAWLVRFKGGGHWLMYQNPEGMALVVRSFLSTSGDLTR